MPRCFHSLLILTVLLLTGCGDYQAGYQHGYQRQEQQSLIVFGKADYEKGFNAGKAERFQEDWLKETPIDTDGLSCKPPTMQVSGLDMSSFGYERVSGDIYRLPE